MCYLIRQRQFEAGRDTATEAPVPGRPRARWGAAVGALLIGGLAVAAAVVVPPAPPQRNVTPVSVGPQASSSTLQSANATVPAGGVVEQTSVPIDDGVPTAYDANRAAMGHCSHDL